MNSLSYIFQLSLYLIFFVIRSTSFPNRFIIAIGVYSERGLFSVSAGPFFGIFDHRYDLKLLYLSEVLTINQTLVSYSYDIYTHIFTCLPNCVRILYCSLKYACKLNVYRPLLCLIIQVNHLDH